MQSLTESGFCNGRVENDVTFDQTLYTNGSQTDDRGLLGSAKQFQGDHKQVADF